jgi:hypothetical protein
VLAYTMPLWAFPIGLVLWPEPLDRAQLIGATIGFAGLVLFMNPGLVDWGNGHILAGNALLLLAAILWALGSCLYRRFSWRSPFWVQTFWQLAVSIVPVAAIVLIEAPGGPVHWSPELVAILAYNCIVTTALGYFLVGKGVVDDAGGDRRTSADADTDRRFRAVYPHIRRSDDSGCPAQRRINRRRHFRNSATVILTHCPPSARAK